jgi:RinA family phage transcriptional activator
MPRQTRPEWWGYAKFIIRQYPRLKKELETPLETTITPNYGGTGGGSGGISRPVERAVIHDLSPKDQKRYDAVDEAIRRTLAKANGQDIMKVIDLVYFQKTHTLAGAAMEIPISENQAGRWNGDFIRLVADLLDMP